ncbi:MAG: DUF4396 domain-containing protein [Acidobacteriaceae bacterium]
MDMTTVSWISIAVAVLCALIIAVDEVRRPQKMAIMNFVWPITALYLSIFALWAYFNFGANKSKASSQQTGGEQHANNTESTGRRQTKPTPIEIAISTSHCGAGCALADIITEFAVAGLGLTLFGLSLWASFAYDLVAAWLLGIGFQYFSIQPMRHQPPLQALISAIKADTLSILSFQMGMYSFMAINFFLLAPHPRPDAFEPRYWFNMQIAMILGFATSYPMNDFLLRRGIKEAM